MFRRNLARGAGHKALSVLKRWTRSFSVDIHLSQDSQSGAVSAMEFGVTEVSGKKIHYTRNGSGNHTLLLMPGALGSAKTDFMPQLENINKDIFTTVVWDPPGYGKSFPPERDFTGHFLENDAHFAVKLMELLGKPRFSVLGWSDGGISALILAALYPENVRKLVVWGSNSYVTPEETEMYQSIRNIDKWSDGMRKPFLEVYGEQYFRKLWAGWIDAIIANYMKDRKGNICDELVPKITAPTLIVHGQKDPMVPQFHPDHLHKHIKGSRLHNFPDGKHNLHLKYYKEFNSLVETFLVEPSL